MENGLWNVYEDQVRAQAYATLEFPGTYWLAFRDLPALLGEHVRGTRAVDFGCGAGRSTQLLRALGFGVVGVDISEPMLALARARDPGGDYRLMADGDFSGLERGAADLVLAAFPFDNIAGLERKVALFEGLRGLLAAGGRIVNIVSSPEIYVNEWVSFSTRDFPSNRLARSGETVRIVMLDVEDRRPVEDVFWTEEAYNDVYERAGLRPIQIHRPLGKPGETQEWGTELRIAPWTLYVLAPAS